MSAQGRGTEKQIFDAYPTPDWPISRYLEAVPELATDEYVLHPNGWCEPCSGAGNIVRVIQLSMLFPSFSASRFPTWHLVDIDSQYEESMKELTAHDENATVTISNFLDLDIPDKFFKLSISNPPYRYAREIVEASIMVSEEVHMLLRINFLGSAKREPFFREYGTPDVFVLPNRPGFFGDGGDATEYAWMRWTPETLAGRPGQVRVLGLTPPEVIKKAAANRPGRGTGKRAQQRKLMEAEKAKLLAEINASDEEEAE